LKDYNSVSSFTPRMGPLDTWNRMGCKKNF
jgi:hypothetical protein